MAAHEDEDELQDWGKMDYGHEIYLGGKLPIIFIIMVSNGYTSVSCQRM
jgi:hypothetical protein